MAQTTAPHSAQPQERGAWARRLGRPLLLAKDAEGRQLDWLRVCPHVRAQESGGPGGRSGDVGDLVTGTKSFVLKGRRKLICYKLRTLDQPSHSLSWASVSGVGTGRMRLLKLSWVGLVLTEVAVFPGVKGS